MVRRKTISGTETGRGLIGLVNARHRWPRSRTNDVRLRSHRADNSLHGCGCGRPRRSRSKCRNLCRRAKNTELESAQDHRDGSHKVDTMSQESVREGLMPFRCFDRGSIPFNGNLLSRFSANDHVRGGPRFHQFPNTRLGTIERPNAGTAMGPVSVNPENVEWQKHLFDRAIRPQTAHLLLSTSASLDAKANMGHSETLLTVGSYAITFPMS